MKNLKTGNYTEFRDISDGLHLRCGELNMTNLGFAKVSIMLSTNCFVRRNSADE